MFLQIFLYKIKIKTIAFVVCRYFMLYNIFKLWCCNLHFAKRAFTIFLFQLFSPLIFGIVRFHLRAKTAKVRGVKPFKPTSFSRITSET